MGALLKIQQAGFKLELTGDDSFKVISDMELTLQQREFLKAHKAEIINELSVNAVGVTKRLWDYQHGKWGDDKQIRCFDCTHFNAIHEHGRGAGHCMAGRQGSGASGLWWHSDCHECELFDLKF